MEAKELKEKILNNTLDDSVLILVYSDNSFIADSYIKEIARIKNREINFVDNLEVVDDIFGFDDNLINVFSVEKLDSLNDLSLYNNYIIKCRDVSENLKSQSIFLPKLEDWMILDYVKQRLPGLKREEAEWLCSIASDIFRLDNEIDKIALFPPASQETIFNLLNEEEAYIDLNPPHIFELSDAIIKLDRIKINNILKDEKYADLEPGGLLTLMIQNYRKIIEAASVSSWTSNLHVSEKQFRYYKAAIVKLYTMEQLSKIYMMLTEFDYKLKSGEIDYHLMFYRIIINILEIAGKNSSGTLVKNLL